jgi:polar amino acid transport system substrate-binding protein
MLAPVVHAQAQADPRVMDLVQSGKVRVALGLGSPALAMKSPTTGEVRGPALDLGRALAARIGVQLEPVEFPRPGAIIEDMRTKPWDAAFLVISPDRTEVDFTRPYMQSDLTCLVQAGSPIRTVAEVDQSGIRIAVPRGDASDLMLSKALKRAELVRADSIAAALDLLRNGQVGAFAMTRMVLMGLVAQAPGSQLLQDGFAAFSYGAAVPNGNAAHLAYLNDFIDDAKASGLVRETIERAGLKGVTIPSAEKSATH